MSHRTALEIRVLGPLEVRVDGATLVVDTRKALAILALLAVEGRPYAREELAAILWPDADDESARGALRRTLSVLKTALGDRWLRVDRATVALDLDGSHLDLAELEAAAGSTDVAVLRRAAATARGPFLAGFSLRDSPEFDDWRATRAVSIERLVADLLDRTADASAAAGDLVGAVAAATRRVDLDSLDESAHRRLMALLARSGDRAGAIRQYRAAVAVLDRELGVAPLTETTELYEAIRDQRLGPEPRSRSATPGPVADAGGMPSPVVLPLAGRDEERSKLLEWHRSAGRDGRVALLVGEAGIGKTRLVEEVAEAVGAARGVVLVARSFDAERGIAYGPIVELIRAGLATPDAVSRLRALPPERLAELERLLPIPALGPARSELPRTSLGGRNVPAARTRLLEAIAEALSALVAGPVPGVIAVEDVQWSDDASRELLAWLARRLSGRPLLLLLTWRPEDLDEAGAEFAATVDAIPGAVSLTLARLDRDAVALLAAAAGMEPAGVDALVEGSEGLPLYVVEALAAGAGAVRASRGVRALLRERLATVSQTAGQVLAAAAVVGRSFDLPLVRGISGRTEDEAVAALEELVRRGLVRELPGGRGASFDFAHARLRDAAYEATSLARRRLLHRRAAELLRADPASRDDTARLVQIATHEREAGRDADAAEAFRTAGLRAQAMYANHEAEALLGSALGLGHPDIAGIQRALGEVRTAEGDYVGAITALEAAAAVATDEALPDIELRLGRVHARRGELATAASHLDAAIADLERRPGTAAQQGLVRALVERAVVAHRAGEGERATTAATAALRIAEAASDDAGAGTAYRMLGLIARDRGDLAGAHDALARSLALAAQDPDPGATIAAGNALALVEGAAGDHAAAIARLLPALALARRTGERHLEAAIENNLADQLQATGRRDEAMAHLKRAVTLFADVGGRPGGLEPEIWKLVAW